MSVIIATAVLSAAAIYWYVNRDKSLKQILKDIRYTLDIQGAGAGGLIDDWINISRNKVEVPDSAGRVAVITGGARGIGKEVIRGLLKANMRVVMGIRNPELAQTLAESMENGQNLEAFKLDLKSLKSVKEFADNVLNKYPRIHLLVNNAGIMYGKYELTEDGFESQLAVNHLSHFYLTHLLLPALKKGGNMCEPSRFVNVTSCAHYPGQIFFDDINMKEDYNEVAAYSQSKLAQLMTTRYVNKLMEENNCPVRGYSVHPGIVNTDLFDGTIFKKIFPWAMRIFFKTPEKGAVSVLYACFNEDLQKRGGLYISNCIEGISSRFSKNEDHQKRLFTMSCELVGIEEEKFGTA